MAINDERLPASVRYNNPGAMWPGSSATRFGSSGYRVLNDGQGNRIAVFDSPVQGAAAQFDLLANKYAGMPLNKAISTWSGGNSSPQYTDLVSKATGVAPDAVLTAEMLKNPEIGIPIARAMARQEAGRDFPMSDEDWKAAHAMAFGGAQPQPAQANVAQNGAINSVNPSDQPTNSSIATAAPTAPTATGGVSVAQAPAAAPSLQDALSQVGSALADKGGSDSGQLMSNLLNASRSSQQSLSQAMQAQAQNQQPTAVDMSQILAAIQRRKQTGALV